MRGFSWLPIGFIAQVPSGVGPAGTDTRFGDSLDGWVEPEVSWTSVVEGKLEIVVFESSTVEVVTVSGVVASEIEIAVWGSDVEPELQAENSKVSDKKIDRRMPSR